ncbi:hypothetical protein [Geodermatophilus sp. DF01-2]|uniref:hypothetical protein n=1 Tax=Geodermatophilus sp. DF01-2 TaxID=2559610 RepID=UPI001FD83754|nr:hypothetical protein [Geodermatophilus sp. DF01_2]
MLEDAGGLLDEGAAVLGTAGEDGVELALADDACISRPMPESLSSSWTSSSRTLSPLISYSLSPERYMRRVIETSV